MDKKDVVYIFPGILFRHKKEILPFMTNKKRMDFEGIMLSEISLT